MFNNIPDSSIQRFSLKWSDNGLDPYHISEHYDYIDQFTTTVISKLKQMITSCHRHSVAQNDSISDRTYSEILVHLHHCSSLHGKFHDNGLKSFFDKVSILLSKGRLGDHNPILIHGPSGCGKTMQMAKICHMIHEELGQDACLIVRFVGQTPHTKDMVNLLRGICEQISITVGLTQNIQSFDFHQLTTYYNGIIQQLVKLAKQMVIVIDGLNHLKRHKNMDQQLEWLGRKLPIGIHVIVSYSSVEQISDFETLECKVSPDFTIQVSTYSETNLLNFMKHFLSCRKRTITPEQESAILRNISNSGSLLHLSLILEESCSWNSRYSPNGKALAFQHMDPINAWVDHLETKYGFSVIAPVMRYISLTQSGLTESELLDLLSCNDELILSLYPHKLPNVVRFPYYLWTDLKRDLGT